MLSLLLLVAQGSGSSPSGSDVAATVKGALRSLGVPGPLRLQSVFTAPGTNIGPSAVVSDRDNNDYTTYFAKDRYRIFAMFRGIEGDNFPHGMSHDLHNPRLVSKVWAWAKAMNGGEKVMLKSVTTDGKIGSASFAITRNGYPFVASTQQYGYSFSFSDPDGRFLRYMAQENPPPVSSTTLPSISDKQAVKIFDDIFKLRIAAPALKDRHWKMSYKLNPGKELGWYLPPGQKVARLVWRIPYMEMRDVGYAIQGGSTAMLIDAVSGVRYSTSVVL